MRDSLKHYIAELAETTAARERMNSELRIAHDIQMDLLPKTFPVFPARPDIDLFALMEPARQVGGDFYDFLFLDHDRLAIAIGDVSGKGIPAALFMGVTRSFLRAELRTDADPGRALAQVSEELLDGNESCMFVTLFCAVVHIADGTVEYANAGHNPPFLARADGRVERIDLPHGPAAAIMPGAIFETGRLNLAYGDTLLLYTDGVTEAMDQAHRLYGEHRLATRFNANASGQCKDCIGALIGDLHGYAAGAEQSDDITMLTFKRLAPGKPAVQRNGDGCLELDIANNLDALATAIDRLDGFLEQQDASPRLAYVARLVLEELVANTIYYGYDDQDTHSIHLRFRIGPPAAMVLEDDGHPFDPLAEAPEPDLDTTAEDRAIGGLGIHMVRSMTASQEYQRKDGINRLEIVFLSD
jgi:sigma-B regulation protein RsbU (phosphoserine phosphatase)